MQLGRTVILSLAGMCLMAPPTAADHSDNAHWARDSNPFTLKVGGNVADAYDLVLARAAGDWSGSAVIDLTLVAGRTKSPRCRPTEGRVEVCSASYGNTGWLGIAEIWISGAHITQGVAKLNDYYFRHLPENEPLRQQVACNLIGHTLGLTLQDGQFDNPNLDSCMDYGDPTVNYHPNQHDYGELERIYRHLDFTSYDNSLVEPGSPGRGDPPFDELPGEPPPRPPDITFAFPAGPS